MLCQLCEACGKMGVGNLPPGSRNRPLKNSVFLTNDFCGVKKKNTSGRLLFPCFLLQFLIHIWLSEKS